MKKLIFSKRNVVISLLLLTLSVTALHTTANIKYIRHFDYTKPLSYQYTNKNLPKKIERLSSTKGEIIMLFDETLPDSIKMAISVAKEIWESKLHNKKPIIIEVYYEPLESGTAISTAVGMEESTNNGNICDIRRSLF